MIELIQNTGIQYIEIALNINEDDNLSSEKSFAEEIEYDQNGNETSGSILFPYKWQNSYIDFDSINAEAIDRNGNVIEEEIKESFVKIIDKKKIYKVRVREALDIYSGHWVPIPYYRTRNDKAKPFHNGPQNWCRMWFGEVDRQTQIKEKCTHKLVLAFDTNTKEDSDSDYLQPKTSDVNDSGNTRFKCVIKERFFQEFYSRHDIDSWLTNLYDLKSHKHKHYFRHYANYFVLLDVLDKLGGFPEISLNSGKNTIETALVLDIGNSRTCGLIVETSSPESNTAFDLTATQKLSIRDLSFPYKTCKEPFVMQVAFADEKFGNEASNFMPDVFNYPSLVRIGKEAIRLTSVFESEGSQATMSSPKRYLWDHNKSFLPWIKVNKDGYKEAKNVKLNALYGISEYLNTDGSINTNGFPTTESRYSRSSLMTFSFVEIMYQALAQINDYQHRKNLGNSSFKRILKNIVISCPTAMTKKEQGFLKASLDNAILLVKKQYSDLFHNEFKVYPKEKNGGFGEETKNWNYDEATCSQIAYLYSELVDKFKGKQDSFFKYKGKKRENTLNPDKESITIASVDIGGGTTDLMICNYQPKGHSEIPILEPTPIFWEGFNIAGDDLVKRIIEFVIIPSIESSIKKLDAVNVEETLKYLFGHNQGNQTATHRIHRKQFANQIAIYCAYEAINIVTNNDNDQSKSIADIFKLYSQPENNLIPYIEETIKTKCKLEEFSLLDVRIDFNKKLINYAIADIIKPIIDKLTKLIGIFDCDILLLSGRSSNIPIINEMFNESLTLSPHKIINFGSYKFGDWYPFPSTGAVRDPKTTVSVGALIAYLSTINRLDKFRINLDPLAEIESTGEYIGILKEDVEKISDSKIIFKKNNFEGSFKFNGAPLFIGMRQVDLEDWIATPLYVFKFKNDEAKEEFIKEKFEYPFVVTINRDEENKEELLMDNIVIVDNKNDDVDPDAYFTLNFRTMTNSNYWKESGSFLIKDYKNVN